MEIGIIGTPTPIKELARRIVEVSDSIKTFDDDKMMEYVEKLKDPNLIDTSRD